MQVNLTTEQLQQWLKEKLSAEIGVETTLINLDTPFTQINLDSLSMVSLAYDLETYTGIVIDPTVFSEFDTPNKLVEWIRLQTA